MNNTPENAETHQNRWVIFGIGYVLLTMVISGYVNYTEPYDPTPARYPDFWLILLWGSLYIPLLVFPVFAKWEVREFGFSINPSFLVVSIFLGVICGGFITKGTTTTYGYLSEAFARTGEEIFFRGFLFLLLVRIFEKKRRPWLWAVIGSSFGFMLVHTQTFQGSFIAQLGAGPIAFLIAQRLLNLFLFALAFALLRHWTKSILPSSIVHCLANGGLGTLPFVLLIYGLITYWAYRRKESVFSGFDRVSKAAI